MRIVARLFVLLPLLWVEGVWGEVCSEHGYTLSSQAEVNALGAEACDTIRGGLTLIGNSDITSLDSLLNLTSTGGLTIQNNTALTNLDGLANLASIGGGLSLSGNDALGNLNGLVNLGTVGGKVTIRDNPLLVNLDGLLNLTSIGDRLNIHNNRALTNLDGLLNLSSVGGGDVSPTGRGDLTITNNAALTNLSGLANLISVGGTLHIHDNDTLTNLNGLGNLANVKGLWINENDSLTHVNALSGLTNLEGDLTIEFQSALTNLDGLDNVTSVGGWLTIRENAGLTDLNGLANVTSVGGILYLEANRSMADCQGVAPMLGWPSGPPDDGIGGTITIRSNSTGCNSPAEILSSVSGASQPRITEAVTSGNAMSLGFSLSTTSDTLFPITGYSALCAGSEIGVSESLATKLLDNTPVQETVTVSGYDPTSVPSSIAVDIDITHSDSTDLYITLTTPEGTKLILWNQGSSGGADLIGTFPTTLTSVDSFETISSESMDGEWVLSVEDVDVGPLLREGVLNSWGIRITEEMTASGAGSPIEVTGITRGRDYTCSVAPVTKLPKNPVSNPYTVSVPYEPPSVPTITSTDFEDGKITLTVSVSDNGGTEITGYEATCTDGTNTYTGTSASSPIAVSGLTNGVAYTCTVTATNSVGTSSASAATAPITPEESTDSLPIWLLYQATQ